MTAPDLCTPGRHPVSWPFMRVTIHIGLSLLLALVPFAGSGAEVRPTGTVHIYRYRLTVGQASHPIVSCDAFPVVKIQNGRVYTMKVSAGRHSFTTEGPQPGADVDVEAGKEYFVRVDYSANATFAVHATPVLVAPEQGRNEIAKLRPLDGKFIEAATCGRP
jgi:hypothetical protein